MESVRVNYFGQQDWQWALTANTGLVPPNSRVVQLEGDVELRSLEGTSNAVLRTDELAIDTEKNLAYSTRSPVQMRLAGFSPPVLPWTFTSTWQRAAVSFCR